MVKKVSDRTQKKKIGNGEPKILSQEQLLKWWPFDRVDGQSLERLHRKIKKEEVLKHSEAALV
jgi:hypothetical protein